MPKVAVTFACGLYDRKETSLLPGKLRFLLQIATGLPPNPWANLAASRL
jgi:hypothetical protein